MARTGSFRSEAEGLVLVGYFAKEIVPRPAWLNAPAVSEVCSVSHCISAAPEGWVERWRHNELGFYDSPGEASTTTASLPGARLFAYRFLQTRFDEGAGEEWRPSGIAPEPIETMFSSLGFDVVSRTREDVLGFECSPLTCNSIAEEVICNAHGLVGSVEQAVELAKRFSFGGAEPGPYYVAEVLEWRSVRSEEQLKEANWRGRHDKRARARQARG